MKIAGACSNHYTPRLFSVYYMLLNGILAFGSARLVFFVIAALVRAFVFLLVAQAAVSLLSAFVLSFRFVFGLVAVLIVSFCHSF